MAIIYQGASKEYVNILEIINICFTSIFMLECVIKIVGMGPDYFKHSWNRFDFIVVIASILDILLLLVANF